MSSLSLIFSAILAATLSLVGMAVGVFYRRKFGEGTHGWLLPVGGGIGVLGIGLQAVPALPRVVGDLVALIGAVVLALGTFWLWYVMMGPRK
ncbi:MAG TPA: hypothetical protein VN931_09665 [Fibrobacteria bacterium]|nr:hypothetical protein [Fibrobacteria bacterium]